MEDSTYAGSTDELIQKWRDGTITGEEVKVLRDEESLDFIEAVTKIGRCKCLMTHPGKGWSNVSEHFGSRCVLPTNHQLHDSDHRDRHGCRAMVLVHQSTIREVAALGEYDREQARLNNPLRKRILNVVSGLATDFMYYDRKEDNDLPTDVLEQAIADGTITLDEIVEQFRKGLS
jgi:hypothetical protein